MKKIQTKLKEIQTLITTLSKDYPAETNASMSFINKAEAGKALDIRQKELINVALAIAAQCEWCIALHVEQALKSGASKDEIIESGFMAVVMHGGPAYMYMIPLMNAIAEFSTE